MAFLLRLVFQAWSTPYFEFEDEESCFAFGSRSFGLSEGFWIDPRSIPKSGFQTGNKKIPDVFPMPGCNAVSQKFKDLVEEFEPGTHQLFPLALRTKAEFPLNKKYYVFNCMTAMDTVLIKPSGLKWEIDEDSTRPYIRISRAQKLVMSTQQIAERHLWTGLYLDRIGSVFCSDAFQLELKRRKIRFLEQTHATKAMWPGRLRTTFNQYSIGKRKMACTRATVPGNEPKYLRSAGG